MAPPAVVNQPPAYRSRPDTASVHTMSFIPAPRGNHPVAGWLPLGAGMNDIVWTLAVSGLDLYAGGWFTTAGGAIANYIAKWNGIAWVPLGSGMDSAFPFPAVKGK